MKPDELIVVGRIVAPHGVRGDLRILPDTDRPEIFKTLKRLKIGGKFYKLLSGRPHKNVYILHVEGVDDRNMAETLIDKIVEVPFSELPERPDGHPQAVRHRPRADHRPRLGLRHRTAARLPRRGEGCGVIPACNGGFSPPGAPKSH